VALVKRSFR